jgi:hypothetical protein
MYGMRKSMAIYPWHLWTSLSRISPSDSQATNIP